MSEQNNNKNKWLHLRLSEGEFKTINNNFKNTTCRKLSAYARKILLGKPMIGSYRNKSLDDFMAEMMKLRADLAAVGNNFNQAVKKLHTLQQTAEFRVWIKMYERDKEKVVGMIEEIKNKINKISDQWLQ